MRIGAWRRPVDGDGIAHKVAKFDARLKDPQERPSEGERFQAACGDRFLIEEARMATSQDRCQRCRLIEVVLL